MSEIRKKTLAGALLLSMIVVFGAGCDYDHDHYRDYGYQTSGRYSDPDYNRDDWRYQRDRDRDSEHDD